jgi:hypothetical protein
MFPVIQAGTEYCVDQHEHIHHLPPNTLNSSQKHASMNLRHYPIAKDQVHL